MIDSNNSISIVFLQEVVGSPLKDVNAMSLYPTCQADKTLNRLSTRRLYTCNGDCWSSLVLDIDAILILSVAID